MGLEKYLEIICFLSINSWLYFIVTQCRPTLYPRNSMMTAVKPLSLESANPAQLRFYVKVGINKNAT